MIYQSPLMDFADDGSDDIRNHQFRLVVEQGAPESSGRNDGFTVWQYDYERGQSKAWNKTPCRHYKTQREAVQSVMNDLEGPELTSKEAVKLAEAMGDHPLSAFLIFSDAAHYVLGEASEANYLAPSTIEAVKAYLQDGFRKATDADTWYVVSLVAKDKGLDSEPRLMRLVLDLYANIR